MTGEGRTFSAFADFVDGTRAIVRRVEVELAPDRLSILLPGGERIDWPADTLRALPDQADPGVLVLTQAGDDLSRLYVADTEIVTRLKANAPQLRKRPPIEHKRRIVGWGVGAVASVALILFVLVPMLAAQLAAYLPPAGEKALGDATFDRIRMALSQGGVPIATCEAPAGMAALAKIEARLGAGPDLPYPVEVTVLDHDLVNAFAMPGGRIVIFRGLIDEAENGEEVAAVLAHELGHVVNRDPTRDALRLAGSVGVLGLIFGDFAGGTVVLLLANNLINARYSQAAEGRADDYAHHLLTEAGVPPAALGTFFERLRAEYGDEEGIAAHFASHPQMTARIEAALAAQHDAEAAGSLGPPVLTPQQWRDLRNICGAADTRGVSKLENGLKRRPKGHAGGKGRAAPKNEKQTGTVAGH